ncbi:iron transport multicopper oxidase FET3 [Nannizzia gypsea CBS 118893]|uniref:Iron transport multicopper oxidase FET3 n=1 Tax=Arthroderma gypseum (strain ATCC MYA-4604 / CBS 118893) TaxID=535722 RepID=E4UZP7_ARTGP|nr:iron transport multicopper oxidase FET3 [Nannizzia gypsea CBS 118893]EFR03577.1 iron transport multicopper oxidase FET3 [Nannizzia gypsea CBS 118893]
MDRPASRRRHNSQRRLLQPEDGSAVADTPIAVQREAGKEPSRPSAGSQTGEQKPQNEKILLPGGPWPLVGFVCCVSTLLVFLRLAAQWQQGAVPNIFDIGSGIFRPSTSSSSLEEGGSVPWSSLLHPEEHVFRPAATLTMEWSITTGYRRLDGVKKRVYLINNSFPGPTIEARSGDSLHIKVINNIQDEGVVLHWHGLHMRGANHMDGVTGVTQCPIVPGDSMLYNFTISQSQSGTFWYHAHSGLQRAEGLYGGLVVHEPSAPSMRIARDSAMHTEAFKYQYEKEHLLLIGDWYHRPAEDVLKWFRSLEANGQEPVPDSLLINGAGRFNCSMALPTRPLDCVDGGYPTPELLLDSNTSHRIRVVNVGSLAGVSLGFEHGTVTPIQVDGGTDVESPSQSSSAHSIGIVYPGQRIDFVLRNTLGKATQSSMTVELDPECFSLPNPALTNTQTFPIRSTARKPSLPLTDNPIGEPGTHIDLADLTSTASTISHIPAKADDTFLVYTLLSKLSANNYVPFAFFNHTSWRPQANPPLPLISLEPENWDKNQFTVKTSSNASWVDLVVNNLDEGPHPFHIHGHDFYVMSIHEADTGMGSYNPWDPRNDPLEAVYDHSRAILRDTVHIPARGHAVLRFRADNAGIWLFHCHILWHLASGMAMLVDVMNSASRPLHDLPNQTCSYLS